MGWWGQWSARLDWRETCRWVRILPPKSDSAAEALEDAEGPTLVVVDDDPTTLDLLTRLLKKKYAVRSFSAPAEAAADLRREPAEIVISDYALPEMNGVEFIHEIHRIVPGAKRIVITGRSDLQTAVDSVNEAQVDFFLTKPVGAEELYQAVEKLWKNRQLEIERDRLAEQNERMIAQLQRFNVKLEDTVRQRTTALSESNKRLTGALKEIEAKNNALTILNESLNVMATVDSLTGLFNRREFHLRLTSEWNRYQRYNRPFSVIMLDIDLFKKVNDTHGHECGDSVLHGLGALLKQHKRRQDVVCRYGGEEFVIILAETLLDAAFKAAEKIRNLVATHTFRCKNVRVPLRVSLGVAGAREHRPGDGAELVKIADQGLYRAKQEGRNRTAVVEGVDSERVLLISGG